MNKYKQLVKIDIPRLLIYATKRGARGCVPKETA
jgi:hypothetical protein